MSEEVSAVITPGMQKGSMQRPLTWVLRATVFRRMVVPLCILAFWQFTATFWPTSFIPGPAAVLEAWWQWVFGPTLALQWYSGTWLSFVLLSVRRVAVGFALAAAFGVTFGMLLGWYSLVSQLFEGVINFMRAIPTTAWVPFAVFFFGIHETAAIFLIAFGAFFPIVTNVAAGARQTPRTLIRAALMLGTPRRMLIWRVVLPASLPTIVTGLRVGLGLSWVLVIVSEMLAVQGGLGYALWSAYQFNRLDLIIAAIISVGALGLASDWGLSTVAARALRWQQGLTGA